MTDIDDFTLKRDFSLLTLVYSTFYLLAFLICFKESLLARAYFIMISRFFFSYSFCSAAIRFLIFFSAIKNYLAFLSYTFSSWIILSFSNIFSLLLYYFCFISFKICLTDLLGSNRLKYLLFTIEWFYWKSLSCFWFFTCTLFNSMTLYLFVRELFARIDIN